MRLFLLMKTCLRLDLEATYSKLEISKFWRRTGLLASDIPSIVNASKTWSSSQKKKLSIRQIDYKTGL